MARWGFGITAGLDYDSVTELARQVAALGYNSLWSNDTPDGDGLATLAAYHRGAPELELGVSVLPLTRHTPEAIGARSRELGLPPEQLMLGVGAGLAKPPAPFVAELFPALRAAVPPGTRIFLAAMGPVMCRLAGRLADGALLNWTMPNRVAWARERIAEGARAAGREPGAITVASYVRVAVGPDAARRLAEEANRYASIPHYGEHFAALGVSPAQVGVAVGAGESAKPGLLPHADSLDLMVVRALPERNDVESLLAVARAAAPGG